MSDDQFKALVARQAEGEVTVAIEQFSEADLPAADVTIDVEYSSFNYKDGLALTGRNSILRSFPIIPGVDYAGTVRKSMSSAWTPGDKVILHGWGVGERWSGGFAQRARAKAEWLVKLPDGLSTWQAMAIGTGGLTAMLCVMALERHGIEKGGDVIVTGAAGGVGSYAVAILSRLGFNVHALTGRTEQAEFLKSLGASAIVDRSTLAERGKPLQAERWHAAVDAVGGPILANILAAMRYNGAVAACGLAASVDIPTSVFPFILRNVALLGVDSVQCPLALRDEAWQRLARETDDTLLKLLAHEVTLEDLPQLAKDIMAGQVRGRAVVKI